jgi:ATP-dependent DNA ligase
MAILSETPAIARTLDARDAILDGEIIVMREHTPDFYALMFRRGQPEFETFDLVWLNGLDLRWRTYTNRKKRLRALLADSTTIGYVEHHSTPDVFEAASRLDLEGITR